VPKDHWAYASLSQIARIGVVEGLPSGLFGGNQAMSRYASAIALTRMRLLVSKKWPPTPQGANPHLYADIPANHWAADPVDRLVSIGLLEGFTDGNFHGSQSLTRYQFAVCVARLLDSVP
jgi:hypothetical protein